MRALAVDPGGSIGWVTAEILTEAGPEDGLKILKWGETKKHQDWLTHVFDAMLMESYSVLVLENFTPRGGVRTWEPAALHQIGALLWMAQHFGVPVSLQKPGDALEFSTPAKISDYREVKGKGGGKNPETGKPYEGHARMALKHLVWWRWNGWG